DEKGYLDSMMNLTSCLQRFALDQTNLRSFLNGLLSLNENLVYNLLNKTNSSSNINFSVLNLEVQAFIVEPDTLTGFYTYFKRSTWSLFIYLFWSTQRTNGIPVVFMNYSNMEDIFAPSFFDKNINSNKTLMSDVISVSTPKINTEWFFDFDITLNHTKNNYTEDCIENYLFRMLDYIYSIDELSHKTAIHYLNITLNLMLNGKKQSGVNGYTMDYGDILLYVHEVLLYSLRTEANKSITFQTLEIQGFVVGSNLTRVITSNATMDIDLTGISVGDQGVTYVGFLSYATLNDVLEQTFFSSFMDSNKSIMSTVVSAVASYYFYSQIPVNFTLKHINELDHGGILLCAQRGWFMWYTGDCSVTQTNRTHTVCSCDQLGTLALFVLTIPCK
ncbi:adhesion G protein-coupled receptor E3-like, partial [Clarias magur]